MYDEAGAALEQGNFARSDELHRECIALFEQVDGPHSLNAASVYTSLADLRLQVGDLDGALQAAHEANAILAALDDDCCGDDLPSLRVQAWTRTGAIQRQRADYSQAETWLRGALDLAVGAFGEESESASEARNELGILYKYTAEFDKAETLYRAALAHLAALYGEQHSSVAAIYHNLGGLEHARRRFAEGEPLGRKAWDINRRLLG